MNNGFKFRSRIPSRIIAALLMTLGIGLRFLGLDRTLGGGDENQYLLDYANTSFSYIVSTFFYGGHHVFHTILMEAMIRGFGDENAIAVRFPSFLSGIATLWLIYKVAQQLFDSLAVARVALLAMALCPIHIYYSQTARGYGLMMFFSTLTLYAALKILDSRQYGRTAWMFVGGGFLSIYTLLTNVYFMFGLASWIFLALLAPRFRSEYPIPSETLKKTAGIFMALFAAVGVLSLSAYEPLWGKIMAEAKSYHLPKVQQEANWMLTANILYGTFSEVFYGSLKWFAPFLIVGVLAGTVRRPSYRWLPVCILFLPLTATLATGMGGYARNYLYNLPLWIVFLAAGMVQTGQWLSRKLPAFKRGQWASPSLVAVYAFASLLVIYLEYYPSIQAPPDGRAYKRLVEKYSDPLDLIIIADPQNFLYARGIYLKNLKNIFRLNKLSGVKIIAEDASEIATYRVSHGDKEFPVFQNRVSPRTLRGKEVKPGIKIFSLAGPGSRALFPEDVEAAIPFKIVRGSGTVRLKSAHKLVGNHSLFIKANPEDLMIVEITLPGVIKLRHNTLAVLLFGGYNPVANYDNFNNSVIVPTIFARDLEGRQRKHLLTGNINLGIRSHMEETSMASEPYDWSLHSRVGFIPPGEYALGLYLWAPKGHSAFYDGLRLFLLELPDTQT